MNNLKLGKTNFIGLLFTDVNGDQRLIKPCKKVKKEVEVFLNTIENNTDGNKNIHPRRS